MKVTVAVAVAVAMAMAMVAVVKTTTLLGQLRSPRINRAILSTLRVDMSINTWWMSFRSSQ
jgi:hypothetical protein